MEYEIYLTKNDKKTRLELKNAGFMICICTEFDNHIWLHAYKREGKDSIEIHGSGFVCAEPDNKDVTFEIVCVRNVGVALAQKRTVILTQDVQEFIRLAKKLL